MTLKEEVLKKLREMMCSGKLYNPLFWEYCREDGKYRENKEYSAMMDEYQKICRADMYEYNSLPHDADGENRRQKLLRKIFGEYEGFRKIEAPFYANYGGKHTKLHGLFYANFNLTLIEDGEIEIGDKTMIGPNVIICTAAHPVSAKIRNTGHGILYNKKIVIGNNVWIGAGAQIFAGVTIGDNCVVGAGSIVTEDTQVPENKVIYGVVSNNNVHSFREVER